MSVEEAQRFELARLHLSTFGSLTNIFCPLGHWSGLVTMKTVNSPSVIAVVQSGGADTTLHILQTLGPGQWSMYTLSFV